MKGFRSILPVLLIALACALVPASGASAAPPPIHHVFVIVLENENEATSFGPGAPSPYLAQTLPSMGVFIPNYYGIGHASLDNYIAMISGQAPDPSTQSDCGTFSNFVPTSSTLDSNGQAVGDGCVYPSSNPSVPTIADQLTTAGDTWKGYMQSMASPCLHPTIGIADTQNGEPPNGPYATRHNPFMYFHSIIDDNASCQAHDVNLSELSGDLASVATTPNYTFITPDVCSDGHDSQSSCQSNYSRNGSYQGINDFLSQYVPMITSSPAYKQDGLLAVIFDESASDNSNCCGEIVGPNQTGAAGGGKTGAVLVSPFIKGGTTSNTAYNHYSLLGSIEDLFGLGRLGMAGVSGLPTFGADVYNAPSSSTTGLQVSNASPSTGQNDTFTATVSPVGSGGPAPTGTVAFTDNGATISSCSAQPLTAGSASSTATCTVSYSAAGSHSIVAQYSGDGNYAGSNSTSKTVTVSAASGGGTTTTTTTTTTTSTITTTPKVLVCPSGRSVTIKLPTGRKRIRNAKVTVNGKKVKITGGSKHPHVTFSLVGRSGSTVTVVVSGRVGRTKYRSVRHYTPCHLS